MSNKILDIISENEALIILRRIAESDPKMANLIEKEAEILLKIIDLEEVCEDVFLTLDGMDVEELWDRSEATRHGYSSPEDMAVEMIEGELEPYNKQVFKYLKLDMIREAELYCMGVLKGIYRYENEAKSEFRDWAEDIAVESFRYLLEKWKKKTNNKVVLDEMNKFLKKECPKWADLMSKNN